MDCVVCEEPITNTVCPECMQACIQQWLAEQREERLAGEVSELTRRVFANNGTTFCIRCDSLMAICLYCYTKEVFDVIKRKPHLVKQYMEYFSFDLDHQGWEKEARTIIAAQESRNRTWRSA